MRVQVPLSARVFTAINHRYESIRKWLFWHQCRSWDFQIERPWSLALCPFPFCRPISSSAQHRTVLRSTPSSNSKEQLVNVLTWSIVTRVFITWRTFRLAQLWPSFHPKLSDNSHTPLRKRVGSRIVLKLNIHTLYVIGDLWRSAFCKGRRLHSTVLVQLSLQRKTFPHRTSWRNAYHRHSSSETKEL